MSLQLLLIAHWISFPPEGSRFVVDEKRRQQYTCIICLKILDLVLKDISIGTGPLPVQKSTIVLSVKLILTKLAKTFYQYKYDPSYEKQFFDFHGLRDFYHLIKCVCLDLIKSSHIRNIEIFSIEKNLAGLKFSLKKAKEKYAEINNNNSNLISQNYNVLKIIKQNIINQEQRPSNLNNAQVVGTSNSYEQRFLLIFKESQNIQIIMESLMKEFQKEYSGNHCHW